MTQKGKLANKYHYKEKELIQHNQCKLKLSQNKFHMEINKLSTITINNSFLLHLQVFGESMKDPDGQLS